MKVTVLRGSQPEAASPGALCAVGMFVALPWVTLLGRQAAAGEVDGGVLLTAVLAGWWLLPPSAVALTQLTRARLAGVLVAWAAAGLVFPIGGAVALVSDEGLTIGLVMVLGLAWALGVVSSVALSLAAASIGESFGRPRRSRAATGGDRREPWSRALVAGLVSCVLIGPVTIVVTGDPVVAAGVCGFVLAANVLGWALVRCPPAVVVRWLAVLGAGAVAVVVLGPDPSPLSVTSVSLCFTVVLGMLCSRALQVEHSHR